MADTEKKLTKEIEMLKEKEKRAVDAADAATAQVTCIALTCVVMNTAHPAKFAQTSFQCQFSSR